MEFISSKWTHGTWNQALCKRFTCLISVSTSSFFLPITKTYSRLVTGWTTSYYPN